MAIPRAPGARGSADSAAVIAGSGITGCVNPAYRKPAAPQAGLGPADSRPVHVSLPATPPSYFGVFEPTIQNILRQVAQFARVIGSQPNLVLDYTYWGEPFIDSLRQEGGGARGDRGRSTWIPPVPRSGPSRPESQDGYLEAFADAVRAFGGPVVISFGHEMNGNWYSWGYTHTSPEVFVRAWRRIVQRVPARRRRQRDVALDRQRDPPPDGPAIRDWWPGGSYVTWAGIDGYLYRAISWNFGNTFAPTISAIRRITAKPILSAKPRWASLAGQAAGIPGLFAGVRRAHLLGLIWFDKAQSRRDLRAGLAAGGPPGR